MDSFESRMNPSFLAESEKGMLWEPRVIESGRGTVEGFKEDKKGKWRASVLSSFSLSWFSVIHVFMSSVHAFSSLVRLVTSLRGADFWSCVIWGRFQPCLYIYTFQWCRPLQSSVTTMKSVAYIHLPSIEDLGESLVHPRLRGWQCFGNGSDLTNKRNIRTSTNLTHNTIAEEVNNNHNHAFI